MQCPPKVWGTYMRHVGFFELDVRREREQRAGMAQWGEPSCPGFDFGPVTCWVEFVAGSRLAPRVFSPGSPVLLPPQNPISV